MKNCIFRNYFLIYLFIPILLAGQNNASNEQDLKILRQLRLTQPLLNKAFDLLAAKNWEGATKQFNRCLEALPENPYACFGMAEISSQNGDIAKALTWIEQAEKGCLYLKQIWANQKLSLFKFSQEEKDRLNQLAVDFMSPGGAGTECSTNVMRDQDESMSRELSKKANDIDISPNPKENTDNSPFTIPAEFFSLHGNLLFKLKRFEEAETQYLAALTIAPNHERCLNNLINIYFISRKFEQAQSWLEKASQQKVKINPGLAQAVRQAKLTEKPQETP